VKWPEGVYYNVGKYQLPISSGDIYLINFSNLHEVYNFTNKDRYSIIITADMSNSKSWKRIIEKSYEQYGKEYLINKSSLKFMLKSRFIKRPQYLIQRLKNTIKCILK